MQSLLSNLILNLQEPRSSSPLLRRGRRSHLAGLSLHDIELQTGGPLRGEERIFDGFFFFVRNDGFCHGRVVVVWGSVEKVGG